MMHDPVVPISEPQPAPARSSGCASSLGRYLVGFLILVVSLLVQVVQWSLEQAVFEGSLPVADVRWMVSLGYALALTVGLGALTLAAPSPRGKTVFRTWLAASLFSLLQVPTRLPGLSDADLIGALQIAGALVFALAAFLLLRKRLLPAGAGGLTLGAGVGILLAIPWVVWGALGSPLDVIINLVIGLLLGVSASMLLNGILLAGNAGGAWSDGLVTAGMLLIMATGLGVNGQQWMLALVLVALSWAAVALSHFRPQNSRVSAWPAAAVLLGLACAWPLLWVDADELALVISSGAGELSAWVLNIVLVATGLALLASFALSLAQSALRRSSANSVFAALLAGLALVGVGALYALFGQPGFYGEHLFVILKDQADLSQARTMQEYAARRGFVYETLVNHADASQADLRAQLERRGRDYEPYYLVNALEVSGGPFLRAWLEQRPEVDRVLSNPILRPLPETPAAASGSAGAVDSPQWNLTMIGADRVWDELGVTGSGVIVGQSDSGAQGDHPELAATYRGAGGQNDYNWYDPWNGSTQPTDIGGHGTHTLGSIVGQHVGVAKGATWIGCVNLARNLGNPAYYLDCMQFMLAPFPQNGEPLRDGDPARGAMVLNNSWGCPDVEGCDPTSLEPAVRALRDAGVFVVVSAGNSGYNGCGSVSDPPAIYDEVYTVGAVDSSGQRADFSSMGPVTVDGSNRTKPDIGAPGSDVLSSYPNSTYEYAGGTSMAGPHVVGVVALMWSANPDLIGDIDRTTEILNETAQPYRGPLPSCASGQGIPNNVVGYGVVDAFAAVQAARQSR
jgi:subtilisin family serine protease